ncbi:SLAP domain-containing protein [Lactobacillus crispatus]|uniref:SLAP domain-containing protein n=1 Tax=Lactobacillus crispatus TaxID=47770 RepID=UPI0039F72143
MKNIAVKSATGQDANGVFQQTITFTVNDKPYEVTVNAKFASQQGTPYFYDKDTNTVVNDGSTVSLNEIANGFTPDSLLSAIKQHYAWKTSDQSNDNIEMTTTASDVESQLVAQALKRASNGSFDYPANGFNLKLTAKTENGNTASITVRINASVNYNAPAFVFDGNVYYNDNVMSNGKTSGNLVLKDTDKTKVIVNGKFNDAIVTDSVKAYVQSAYGANDFDKNPEALAAHQQLVNPSNIKIDSSKVNASVAGMYPVTITATNPAGFTSKLVVYAIVMGPTEKAPQEYVKADNTKVYNINGNVVSEAANVPALSKGAAVYTFGKVTVNGVEYTRINKEGSNEFVKSSDLTATKPDTTVLSQPKTIMHNAYYYDKDAKRVGTDKLTRYNSVNVAMSTTTIKGKAYYEVIENGKATGKFINADNIDGTKRTLKHNAYVYKSSKKRANKVVLKKGKEVTTYGGTYTFKNGKQYYKIGNNTDKTYVKASNF